MTSTAGRIRVPEGPPVGGVNVPIRFVWAVVSALKGSQSNDSQDLTYSVDHPKIPWSVQKVSALLPELLLELMRVLLQETGGDGQAETIPKNISVYEFYQSLLQREKQ